jgi:hypothetical protein
MGFMECLVMFSEWSNSSAEVLSFEVKMLENKMVRVVGQQNCIFGNENLLSTG